MNCTESQDLLLDLAYGELPPARAAEVLEHVEGCAACRAEKEQLEDARRAVAPLRELEEPPAGFDEPILQAARAAAGLHSDGMPGPVVEVSATVKPLGLQAARLDPHATMSASPGRARPRWGRRAAAAASIAAAAGLAVVVTSSVTHRPPQAPADVVAPIRVRSPEATVPGSLDDAMVPGKKAAAPEGQGGRADSAKFLAAPPPQPAASPPGPRGGETTKRKIAQRAPAPEKEQLDRRAQPEEDVGAFANEEAQHGLAEPKREEQRTKDLPAVPAMASPPAGIVGGSIASGKISESAPASSQQLLKQAGGARASADAAPAQNPDQLEDEAGKARRQGNYARAAALYQEASALRKDSDPARAAWDLAHAVECLAAGGQVQEAIAARRTLRNAYPGQAGQQAAADRALRSVQIPADDPASQKNQ